MSVWRRPRWRAPLCAVVAIAANRAINPRVPILTRGLLDESAHLASTALALEAIGTRDRRLTTGALAAGVLIDVDHVPHEIFGWRALTEGSPRPYSHSLATIALILALARVLSERSRTVLQGVSFGLVTHFLRDASDGTGGLPLLWPLSRRGVRLPATVNAPMILAILLWTLRPGAPTRDARSQ